MTVKTMAVFVNSALQFEAILNQKLEELQKNEDVDIIDIKYTQQRTADYVLVSALIIFEDEPLEDEGE